ncbi:unnamed protein product [Didymodactylos carnosus]|nr:unnamed protein product [Didymodactylos carnosus]CAF3815881.1 unnamed protein product [Didymodactylos carnosus]
MIVMCCRSCCHSDIDENRRTASQRVADMEGIRKLRPRPKLRFQHRLAFLVVCFVLRSVATALYATAPAGDNDSRILAALCGASLAFLFLTLILDLYRYSVWWHYTPQNDTHCYCRSRKHERYIPYHLIGDDRDANMLGDRPCTKEDSCRKTRLDHITVFHSRDYKPQRRWRDVKDDPDNNHTFRCTKCDKKGNKPHYIGFHTTTPEAAKSIARSHFRPSWKGMLGAGVYFARSPAVSMGKANHRGAWIVAEIRMGRVFEIERPLIMGGSQTYDAEKADFVRLSAWHTEYDTCYLVHNEDNRDEFCIKDPATQIIKWTIVVQKEFDSKVASYGLDTEFDSTECYCI